MAVRVHIEKRVLKFQECSSWASKFYLTPADRHSFPRLLLPGPASCGLSPAHALLFSTQIGAGECSGFSEARVAHLRRPFSMAKFSHVKFPPLMLERALKYYARIAKALVDGDTERNGKISRKQFAKIFATFSVEIDDAFVRVMDAFDCEGEIDHKQFIQAVSERLFPPRPPEGMSLAIPPTKFFEEKGRGRCACIPLMSTRQKTEGQRPKETPN